MVKKKGENEAPTGESHGSRYLVTLASLSYSLLIMIIYKDATRPKEVMTSRDDELKLNMMLVFGKPLRLSNHTPTTIGSGQRLGGVRGP